jgi:hypothetical protein
MERPQKADAPPSLVPFAAKALTETSIRGAIGSREPPVGEMADDDTPEKTLPSVGMNGESAM